MLYYKTYNHESSKEWVVLVHGAGGSSSIWFRQVRTYRKYFNVLFLDLRGHGKSQDIVKETIEDNHSYTFKEISCDVIEVLDHLNIEKAHFVGISLGTIIIRCIADIDEKRVKTMILGGAVTRLTACPRILVNIGHLVKRVIPYMLLYKILAFIIMPKKRHEKSRLLFVKEATKVCHKEFLRWFSLTSDINPLLRYFEQNDKNIPTLYIMGEEDYMFLAPVQYLVEKKDTSVLEVLKDSGHVCNVDKPDEFNHISLGFIQLHSDPNFI